jgi:hypothetical protein
VPPRARVQPVWRSGGKPVVRPGESAGYAEFFHLQDLVNEATSTVKFLTSFDDFTSPLPGT